MGEIRCLGSSWIISSSCFGNSWFCPLFQILQTNVRVAMGKHSFIFHDLPQAMCDVEHFKVESNQLFLDTNSCAELSL